MIDTWKASRYVEEKYQVDIEGIRYVGSGTYYVDLLSGEEKIAILEDSGGGYTKEIVLYNGRDGIND